MAGIAAAGFVLDIKGGIGDMPFNRIAVSGIVIGISLVGVLMSFGVAQISRGVT